VEILKKLAGLKYWDSWRNFRRGIFWHGVGKIFLRSPLLYVKWTSLRRDYALNKQDIYRFLDEKMIQYEVSEHEAVYNMAELANVNLPYPDADAKNLFVRDDKKQKYYLITVRGDKRVNLKEFRRANKTRPLTFASEEDLFSILKLTPGSVTPFGILNDDERKVEFYLDESFLETDSLIGVHPNDNTATVWLRVKDLISIIKEHGNPVHVVSI